jgi:hypothetical protein
LTDQKERKMSAPVYRSRFDNRYLCSYVALFLLFAVVAQPATAASRDQLTEGAKREGEIILYASMNVEEANAMIARFQAKYPFVKVKFNRAGNEKLLTKLFAEARAKGTFADAIQTLGFSMYTLQKKQMLGYYLSPENSFYPKEFKDEGYWTTVYTNLTQPLTIRSWSVKNRCRAAMRTCSSRCGEARCCSSRPR